MVNESEKLTYANMGHLRNNEYLICGYLNGEIVAEFHGHWKPKKCSFLIYPKKIRWHGKRHLAEKKEIGEREIVANVVRR